MDNGQTTFSSIISNQTTKTITIRNLSDKSLEKRKIASAEIVEKVEQLEDEHEILKMIKYFSGMVDDESAQKRRSGLYGLGSIAISLYDRTAQSYLDFMLKPVLESKCNTFTSYLIYL